MSIRLTDLLLELCEPAKMREYMKDKERFVSKFNLDDTDRAALAKATNWIFRVYANSIDDDDRRNSVNQFKLRNEMMEVAVPVPEIGPADISLSLNVPNLEGIDVHAEVDVDQGSDLTALEINRVRLIDGNGRVYVARGLKICEPVQ
jgi:hypothetical protein